jgi:hypothetical protein
VLPHFTFLTYIQHFLIFPTMKKRSLLLLTYGLAMTLVLFNCKKDDNPVDPEEPDTQITDSLKNVTITPIVIVTPAPVTVTPSSLTASAEATALANDMASIVASGTVPASVTAAAANVSAALSESEIATLSSLTPEAIAAIQAGGAFSPELKAVMDKVAADPILKGYLPTFSFPTVGGAGTRASRIASVEAIELVENIEVNDACIDAANAIFNTKKTELDGIKATEDTKVAAAFSAATATLASDETACKTDAPNKFAATATAITAQVTKAKTDLDAAKSILGDVTYKILYGLINAAEVGAYNTINNLKLADSTFCTQVKDALTAAANVARLTNEGLVTIAYNTAITAATGLKNRSIQSCHNQGSGN